jgi:hypothetical protein
MRSDGTPIAPSSRNSSGHDRSRRDLKRPRTLIAHWRRKRDTEIVAVFWLCETEPAGTGPTELCAQCVNELSRPTPSERGSRHPLADCSLVM